jgi:hypothetical protein
MRIPAWVATNLAIALWVSHTSTTVLAGNLTISRSIADRRQLRSHAARVGGWRALRITLLTVDWVGLGILAVAFLGSLALVLFLLLSCFPLFSDLLEFCDGMKLVVGIRLDDADVLDMMWWNKKHKARSTKRA